MSFLLVCILLVNCCILQVNSQGMLDPTDFLEASDSYAARDPEAVKRICQNLANDTFYEESTKNCYPKLYKDISQELFGNGTLNCHFSSEFLISGSGTALCYCPNHLEVNPDEMSCSEGKFFNEPCSDTQGVRCNRYAGLICNDKSVCACDPGAIWNNTDLLCYSDSDCGNRKYGSYFDENDGSCFIPLDRGGSCELADPMEAFKRQSVGRIPKAPTCPPNSKCIHASSGYGSICKCNHGYSSNSETKKCIPVKTYKQACEKIDDGVTCDEANGLECNNNFCECRRANKFEKRSGRCIVPVGADCNTARQCGKNSSCNTYHDRVSKWGQKCECQTGFIAVNGFCLAKHLDGCTENDDCLDGLLCIDAVCRCASPLGQKISKDGRKCHNLVGSPCNLQTTLVSGARCLNGKTTCAPPLKPSITGECYFLKPFGSACAEQLEGQCDFQSGLACIDKTCRCFDPSLKHVPGVGCVASVGSTCGEMLQVGGSSTEDLTKNEYHIRCEEPSACIPVSKLISKCNIKS